MRTIVMNPIPNYAGYLFTAGNFRGIKADADRSGLEQIHPKATIDGKEFTIPLNKFFTDLKVKYFSFEDIYTKEGEEESTREMHYFSQTGHTLKEIDSLPEEPAHFGTIEGDYGLFLFTVYPWQNVDYNRITRQAHDKMKESIVTSEKGFSSALLTSTGLFYSQPEKVSREAGLYYMGNDQLGGPTRLGECLVIWE